LRFRNARQALVASEMTRRRTPWGSVPLDEEESPRKPIVRRQPSRWSAWLIALRGAETMSEARPGGRSSSGGVSGDGVERSGRFEHAARADRGELVDVADEQDVRSAADGVQQAGRASRQ